MEKSLAVKDSSSHFSGFSETMNTGIIELRESTQKATLQAGVMSDDLKSVVKGCEETSGTVTHLAAVEEMAQKSEKARKVVEGAAQTTL